MKRLRRPAPLRTSTRPSTCALSGTCTRATSIASAGMPAIMSAPSAKALKTILNPRRPERGARPPRGMALHVHRHWIHGDVRGGRLHVHGEGSRVAAETLRPDAERVHRLGELG